MKEQGLIESLECMKQRIKIKILDCNEELRSSTIEPIKELSRDAVYVQDEYLETQNSNSKNCSTQFFVFFKVREGRWGHQISL